MKIAIAQLNYTIGDVDGNASKIIDSIHKAKAQHADLVIFAEQAVSGTPAFDLLRKTTFLELCEDALVEIASCCDGIAAIVGLPILTADGTISAAALIQDRKVLRYIGKKYITARREMGFLVPSKGYEYATIKGHKCAIIVGDDLSRERDFDQSVETVISINARKYGKGIPVGYAFRRIWEGGHGTRSQHYAGVSFDVGQSLTQTARTAIYNAARGTGAWGYVEPLSQTPTWVHMDRRYGTPACSGTTAGYPTLRRGSRGCYVMILQDALSTLGYQTGSRIDGIFGARTEEALKGFQRRTSLRVDGVCGCNSWKKISTAVIGVGRTKTTID
jgi:hypothetical protein